MPKLPYLQDNDPQLSIFIIQVNQDISAINNLITLYNQPNLPSSAFQIIKKLYQYKLHLDHKYPENLVSRCSAYRDIILTYFHKLLRRHAHQLGIMSLSVLKKSFSPIQHPQHAEDYNDLAELLTNMTQEKANILLSILSLGAQWDPKALYNLYQPDDPLYLTYINLLSQHQITFLGGNNSKNFKVTQPSGRSFVLKVENHLGESKIYEQQLRNTPLSNYLAPTYAERQASCWSVTQGCQITRTICITQYYGAGNLQNHAKKHGSDYEFKARSALVIYKKMAHMLVEMEQYNCFFTDLKTIMS